MRLINIALLILSLAIESFAQQTSAPARKPESFFPVAVWYGGGKARAPMLEANPKARRADWQADLRKIKQLGFNAIRCWIDWASIEPAEKEFNFETIDQLMELAQGAGLKVIIQVYADSAPDWVGKRFPDSHFISISGDVMPSHAAPGYCFDHAGVRRAVLGFFTAVAERVKNQPAFLGWDLWSEPHVINWAQATYMVSPEFCFCPSTVARFREWLRKKYGSLDKLNAAWYRRFADWSEVGPNRLSTILSYTDYVDWRYFIAGKLAEDLRMRFEAVKRVAPDKVATSHAAAPSLFTSPLAGDGSPDDWLMARQVDFWGTSFYPKHSFPVGRDREWRGALLDFTRSSSYSAAHGFWVGELQGGFGTVALRVSSTVTPEDLKVWTWSAIARGAKGINFYAWYPMSSGYESGGFGLINLDGTITERAKLAGEIAQVVSRNQELFLNAHPAKAEVAIVYNPLSYMVGGRRPLGVAGPQSEFASIERNSMLGTYRALWASNVPVDFIHINEVAEGKAGRYKLILLQYPLMITEPAARGLIEYVRNGGALVSEARLAWNDDRGFAKEIIPGFGLHEVCGCREAAVQQTASGKTDIQIVSKDESIPRLNVGDKLRGVIYEEALEPISSSARVVARFADGSPAIVASSFGKGKMLAVGTFFGLSYEAERSESLVKFFTGLLDWAGIARPVEVKGLKTEQAVEVRVMESGEEKLAFVFNHGSDAVEPEIHLALPRGNYSAKDLVTEQAAGANFEGGALVLKKKLAASDVWVVRVSQQ